LIFQPASNNAQFVQPMIVNRFPTPGLKAYYFGYHCLILKKFSCFWSGEKVQ